jgi:hypothetical protein
MAHSGSMARDARQVCGGLLAVAGLASVLAGLFVLMLEILGWLKYARWSPIDIRDAFTFLGIPEPYLSEWWGAQKLWNTFSQAPLSLVAIIAGLASSSASGVIYSKGYYKTQSEQPEVSHFRR